MDCARDATLEYLRTRRQFGAPIGSFQALQHRMADLLLEIEQARSAVINAAAALDRRPAGARAGAVGGQVHHWPDRHAGGRGEHPAARRHRHDLELPLAHYAKRLVMIDHQLGDEDHHLRRYIALGRQRDRSAS